MKENFLGKINPIIGFILEKADTAEDLMEKFNFLYYSLEATIKFMVIFSIIFYRRENLYNESIESELKRLKKPSIGTFQGMLRKIYKELSEKEIYPIEKSAFKRSDGKDDKDWQKVIKFYKDVVKEYGGEKKSSISVMDFLDLIINFRNKTIGHGSVSNELVEKWIKNGMEDVIEIVLNRISEINKYELLYLEKIVKEKGGIKGKFKKIRLSANKPIDLPIDETFYIDRLYLYDEKESKFFDLHPFIIFIDDNLYILNESGNKILYLNYLTSEQKNFLELDDDINAVIGVKEHKGFNGKVFKVKDKPIVIVKGLSKTEICFGNIARKGYGDDELSDINFRFPEISRRHFRLTIRDEDMLGEDIESKFGVFYAGKKQNPQLPFIVKEKASLILGTMIEFSIFKDSNGNYLFNYVKPSDVRLLFIDEEQTKLLPDNNTIIIILKNQISLKKYGINAKVGVSSEGIILIDGDLEFEKIDNIVL